MSIAGDSARVRLLYELGCSFAARVELRELVPLVIEKCREALDAEAASVLLLDAARSQLYFPYVVDEDPTVAQRLLAMRFPADHGIAGAVLRDGLPLRVDDVANDPRFFSGADQRSGFTTRNLLSAPLTSRQGSIGVLQVVNRRGDSGFSDADLTFLETLAGSVAVAIENARLYADLRQTASELEQKVEQLEIAMQEHEQLVAIRHELDIARSIQQSILPRSFTPIAGRANIDIFAAMLPAREVGGDFYDFFRIDDERLGLVIGDVSGKGVPAAIFMSMSRTLLKSTAMQGAGPAECLRHVNSLLCLDNQAEMFVSIFYGILDTRGGQMVYSNGGHNPPYVLRHGGTVEPLARTAGLVLGVLDDANFAARPAILEPGDGIFLYTDGITEAMDASGALFSDQRLHAYLERAGSAGAEELVRGVVAEVGRHANEFAQSDDITALCVRRPL